MGRSRSILVTAVYLVYKGAFPTLSAALSHVKSKRQITNPNMPRPELMKLGEALLSQHPDLFQKL
jgi:protein-tyrosine phosphatase